MKYEVPVCEFVKLSDEDIITASNLGDTTTDPGDGPVVDITGGSDPGSVGSES